jgi:uncharacterized protein
MLSSRDANILRAMDGLFAGVWSLCAPAVTQGGLLGGLFVAGAAGSAMHCVPMCGGFVLGQVADRMSRLSAGQLCEWQRLRAGLLLPYHLGRLTTYAALGALAATSAAVLGHAPWFSGLSSVLLVLAALLFLSHAAARLFALGGWTARTPAAWARLIARLTRGLDRGRPGDGYALGLGLGLLPCGFLYGAIMAAAATGRPEMGMAAMLAFGLGTVPALVVTGVAGNAAGHRWRHATALAAPPLMALNAVLLLGLAFKQLG